MNCNWPIVKLGDYCSKIGSGATPKGGNSVYLDHGEISLIRSQNIYNEGFKSDGLVYITPEAAQKLKNVIIEPNDVLINITGDSVARVCLAPNEFLPARVNQHVAILRVDPEEFDPRYLRYFLTSTKMQNYLLTIASTGGTRNALTKSMLESLEVSKPSLDVQNRIGDALESFETKIELNSRTNQTLEEMAQAIFKSWFVDFEPVKAKMNGEQPEGMDAATASLFPEKLVESELGLIPDGWRVDSLGNYLDVLETGKRPKGGVKGITEGIPSVGAENILGVGNYQYGKEKFIPEDLFVSLKKGVVESEDVLIYKDGGKPGDFKPRFSMFGYGFPYKTFAINEHVFRIRSSKLGQPYLYCQMRDDYVYNDLRNKGAKAAIPGINQKDVKSMLIVVPNELLLSKFNDSVASIFEMILKNALQSQELAKLRDTLLPKLLSGEIELGTSEELVEAI